MKAIQTVDTLLEAVEAVDAPPSDISGYIEDVLPMNPTEGDTAAAFTKRGFQHRDFDGVPPTPVDYWMKLMPGGQLQVKQDGSIFRMQYWPNGPWPNDVVIRHGDIRTILREVDRLVHAFTPPSAA